MRVLVLDRLVPRRTLAATAAVLLGVVVLSLVAAVPVAVRAVPVALVALLVVAGLRQRVRVEVTGDEVVLEHRRFTTGRVRLAAATQVHLTASRGPDTAGVGLRVVNGDGRATALLLQLGRSPGVQPPEVLQALADGLARNLRGDARQVSDLLQQQLEHGASGLPLHLSPLAALVPERFPRTTRWPA